MTHTPSERERSWLLAEKYHGEETPDFFADVERLKEGEPLAYVIGTVPFLGCTIDLSYRPFIPRPETEWWLEKALTVIKERTPNATSLRLLDVFSGSGAIGVAAARHLPGAHVDFSEQDPRLVKQIKKNIALN
ncbi:MAG: RsmD family RNA methyltransferase, partial [Candidatus Spechtbacterales bacterium]